MNNKNNSVNYRQSLKQEDMFQFMIKKAHGQKRQKKLIGLKRSYIINTYGQHLRPTSNI